MSDAQSDTFEPQFKYYKSVTVHADDTLWDIARDYYAEDQYSDMSEYISEICSINRLGNVNMIKSGEELIIPYYSAEFK
jgi:nucleoid-associated protein YgaU